MFKKLLNMSFKRMLLLIAAIVFGIPLFVCLVVLLIPAPEGDYGPAATPTRTNVATSDSGTPPDELLPEVSPEFEEAWTNGWEWEHGPLGWVIFPLLAIPTIWAILGPGLNYLLFLHRVRLSPVQTMGSTSNRQDGMINGLVSWRVLIKGDGIRLFRNLGRDWEERRNAANRIAVNLASNWLKMVILTLEDTDVNELAPGKAIPEGWNPVEAESNGIQIVAVRFDSFDRPPEAEKLGRAGEEGGALSKELLGFLIELGIEVTTIDDIPPAALVLYEKVKTLQAAQGLGAALQEGLTGLGSLANLQQILMELATQLQTGKDDEK